MKISHQLSSVGRGVILMGKYKLSRIYLQNYKVFDQKELNFEDCSLAVFDGPNGYGKTSVFDAIEFVITGNIKRVFENSAIIKNDTYETVFIARNSKKDVIIKAEFIAEDKEPIIIAKIIPGINKPKKVKKNNPTKLGEITNTYILPSYDISEYHDDYKCEHSDIERKLGSDVIEFFSLFHYIRQEDRLDFLKRNENDRMAGINRLFNMENEQKDLDDSKRAIRQLNKSYKDLSIIIKKEEEIVKKLEETLVKDINNTEIKYEQLFTWKREPVTWDEKIVTINDIDKKNEIISLVKEIDVFIKYFSEFQIDEKNTLITNLLENKENLLYYLYLFPLEGISDDIKSTFDSLKFLKTEKQAFRDGKYILDYKRICQIVDIDVNIELINEIVKQIKSYESNSNELANTASNINQAREILDDRTKKFADDQNRESQCSFCGYDWGNAILLREQIDKMTESFNKFTDGNTTQKENKINKLKDIFESTILPEVEGFILNNCYLDNEIAEYVFDSKNDIENKYRKFISDCKKYNINIEVDTDFSKDVAKLKENAKMLETTLLNAIKTVSEEYINVKGQINFGNIYSEYFYSNSYYVNNITSEKVICKMNYIEYNYYNATFQKIEKHKSILSQHMNKSNILNNEIIPKTEQYRNMLQNKIETYQSQIIKSIEIPFYIYSGRIMQSYQGGIGVLIKEPEYTQVDNDELAGLKSIRFISPSRADHDILYTLSSGQLSSVIIAFTLALNKIYSNETFKCIFIDDPVQTMDELNIASFVELLRNEFSDRQIVLSTHEDSFSRYTRYKYEKYNLIARPITLKDS